MPLIRTPRVHSSNSHLPAITDPLGIPRYWATIWSALFLQHLAASTATKKLRDLDDFYLSADECHYNGYLDDLLGQLNIEPLGATLESYFISLKNRSSITSSAEKRWQTWD